MGDRRTRVAHTPSPRSAARRAGGRRPDTSASCWPSKRACTRPASFHTETAVIPYLHRPQDAHSVHCGPRGWGPVADSLANALAAVHRQGPDHGSSLTRWTTNQSPRR